jgi:CheY-like chemotaxis protein
MDDSLKRCVLWVEDDHYAIKSLVRPLEKIGFTFDVATSAAEAYDKAKDWQKYDMFVIDLILPETEYDDELPPVVSSWLREKYLGIGLAKWLCMDLKVTRPVVLLSVVRDPIGRFGLEKLGLAAVIAKPGLLPSELKQRLLLVLETAPPTGLEAADGSL